MLKLFRLILGRNLRSVLTLFFVLFLASTGFLVMRELTENIRSQERQDIRVAESTRRVRDWSLSHARLAHREHPIERSFSAKANILRHIYYLFVVGE